MSDMLLPFVASFWRIIQRKQNKGYGGKKMRIFVVLKNKNKILKYKLININI